MHSQLSTPTRLHASTIAIIAQVRATRNCRCVTCARLRALCLCTRILSLRWPQASRAAMAPADVHRALRIRRARRYSSYTQRVGRCDAPRPAHGAAACLAQPDLHLHSNARAERAHPSSPKDKQKNFRHLACTRAVLRLMSGFLLHERASLQLHRSRSEHRETRRAANCTSALRMFRSSVLISNATSLKLAALAGWAMQGPSQSCTSPHNPPAPCRLVRVRRQHQRGGERRVRELQARRGQAQPGPALHAHRGRPADARDGVPPPRERGRPRGAQLPLRVGAERH